MKVPIIKLALDDDTIAKVNQVLRSGIWAEHHNVHALEEEFASYIGVKHARAVNNGTSALICALSTIGIGPGDEIIVPSFTFIATANVVLHFGAKPVFADVDRDTFNLNVEDVRQKISDKTKAIMPVHLYGLPAAMDEISELAADKGIAVVEDACQAHGASYKGKKCGAIGDIAAFSLYPTKNMFCGGEGGLVTTNNDDYHQKVLLYSNHGQSAKYVHSVVGFNYRMQDANAVVARASLAKLDENNDARRANAAFYNDAFSGIDGIEIPVEPEGCRHVYHQYTLKVKNRDKLAEYLKENGIGFGIHYGIPAHQQESMKKLGLSTSLPVTEHLAGEVISLPVHPLLTIDELEHVAKVVKAFY